MVEKPFHKAIGFWHQGKCQRVPEMKRERFIEYLIEQISLLDSIVFINWGSEVSEHGNCYISQ